MSSNPSWKDFLPGCFGNMDKKFARHPLDEARAKTMVSQARLAGASDDDIIDAAEAYLRSLNAPQLHIEHELMEVQKFLR